MQQQPGASRGSWWSIAGFLNSPCLLASPPATKQPAARKRRKGTKHKSPEEKKKAYSFLLNSYNGDYPNWSKAEREIESTGTGEWDRTTLQGLWKTTKKRMIEINGELPKNQKLFMERNQHIFFRKGTYEKAVEEAEAARLAKKRDYYHQKTHKRTHEQSMEAREAHREMKRLERNEKERERQRLKKIAGSSNGNPTATAMAETNLLVAEAAVEDAAGVQEATADSPQPMDEDDSPPIPDETTSSGKNYTAAALAKKQPPQEHAKKQNLENEILWPCSKCGTTNEEDDGRCKNCDCPRNSSDVVPRVTRARAREGLQSFIKCENQLEGNIRCPVCHQILVVGDSGCNIVTCRNHKPSFVYFCLHCKKVGENGSEIVTCEFGCSKRNSRHAREEAQKGRNERAAANPVGIDDQDEGGLSG